MLALICALAAFLEEAQKLKTNGSVWEPWFFSMLEKERRRLLKGGIYNILLFFF